MTKLTQTTDNALTKLADRINVGHLKCLRVARTALEHARHTGNLLLEAKGRVIASGKKWLDWVQGHCKCSIAEAQRYMRIANHYGALLAQGKDNLAKLSLTQALRLLSPGAEKTGKGQSKARPFKVASGAEVKHLARKAEGLAVPDDSPEARFLAGTVAGLAQRILAQAKKTHLTNDRGQPLSPAEVAVALLGRLKGGPGRRPGGPGEDDRAAAGGGGAAAERPSDQRPGARGGVGGRGGGANAVRPGSPLPGLRHFRPCSSGLRAPRRRPPCRTTRGGRRAASAWPPKDSPAPCTRLDNSGCRASSACRLCSAHAARVRQAPAPEVQHWGWPSRRRLAATASPPALEGPRRLGEAPSDAARVRHAAAPPVHSGVSRPVPTADAAACRTPGLTGEAGPGDVGSPTPHACGLHGARAQLPRREPCFGRRCRTRAACCATGTGARGGGLAGKGWKPPARRGKLTAERAEPRPPRDSRPEVPPMARDEHAHEDLQPLLDRLAAGDEAAADLLIERSVERMHRLAHFLLKARFPHVRRWYDTDDVLQNAALRLRRALKAVTPASPRDFLKLAGVQIRRELTDLARHEFGPEGSGRHHVSGPAGPAPDEGGGRRGLEGEDPGAGSATEAQWRDFLRYVEGAMPAEQREVFDLLYVQGLSQQEAAHLLDVSVPTVRRRWRSARLLLHRAIHGKPGEQ